MSKEIVIKLVVLSYNMKLKEEPFVLYHPILERIPEFEILENETCLESAKKHFTRCLGFEPRTNDLERGWVTIKFLGIVDKLEVLELIYGCILPEISNTEWDSFMWKKISQVNDEALTIGIQNI